MSGGGRRDTSVHALTLSALRARTPIWSGASRMVTSTSVSVTFDAALTQSALPVLVRTSYASAPLTEFQLTVITLTSTVTVIPVGAGSVGVAATYHGGPEGLPAPPAFTARSLKRYSVPLASPSTAAVVTLPGTAAHWPQATPAQRTLYS